MAIHHSCDNYEDTRVVMLSQDGDKVRFERVGDSKLWLYRSMRAGEDLDWVNSPQPAAPLETHWHHAMVFFGVIDPDDASHPPTAQA